jgi:predicted metal-dependent phosphoesterase TrpH
MTTPPSPTVGMPDRPVRGHRALNIDLHSHSWVSDGTLSPVAVVERAYRHGVTMLALTDHDEVAGVVQAHARARVLGMRLVTGVEISVTWAGHTVHIVGLRLDVRHPVLLEGLARNRLGRDARAREIGRQLDAVGVPEAYHGALRLAGNPAMLARSHFARHLVAAGVCANTKEAFGRFLVSGRPGFVPHEWANLHEALSWIHAAGGVAVVAHPGRYPLPDWARDAFLTEFCEGGGEAIEVVCGSHHPDQYREFAALAQRFGLSASRGSDFHAPGEGGHDVGQLPELPLGVRPVWHDWLEETEDTAAL